MTWLPALLAAVAVVVAVGLPAPRRLLARQSEERNRRGVPAPMLGAAVSLVLLLPAGPVGAGVGGVLAVVARRAQIGRRKEKARRQERTGAAEAMAVLAAELRAGRPPGVALGYAGRVAFGPTSRALGDAGAATGIGVAAADILHRHADSSAVPDLLRGLAVCWQVCQGSGSSLAVAVQRLEEALRAEQLCLDEVEAELAGPRSTAALLAVLPAFGVLMGASLGAHPIHVLLHTLVGSACLVVGIGLEFLGVWWTGRIVRAAGAMT